MRKEAATAGFYHSPGWNKDFPRLQILTIEDLLNGKGIDYPLDTSVTFKKAPKANTNKSENYKLDLDGLHKKERH